MRLGFAADLLNIACFVLVALLLNAILKHINDSVALGRVVLNAVSAAIMGLNMLNHLGALLVATQPAYTASLNPGAADGLALLLDLHRTGFYVAQIFFGLWLLPLGYLVYRAGFLPRLLGGLLMLGAPVTWLIW